jgi:hypothetical protein
VSGKAFIQYKINSTLSNTLTQFGLANPLSLAWEILPYSFVVDWMLPIGPWLSNLDYTNGLSFDHGWINYKANDEVKGELVNYSSVVDGWTRNWTNGNSSGTAMVFHRDALGDFPSPPLPRLKNPFSPIHVSEALSLLAGAFRPR